MNWARPELLNLLWAIPVIALGFGLAFRSRRRALAALGPLMSARISARSMRIHAARAGLWTLALASFVVALAQPRWDFQWQELRQEGLSLVVVLDVSRSMDAEDVPPSRMERARREVRDLAGMLVGDRVGLVLSAGGAYAQMPLTQDYAVLDALARRASSDILRAQGSDLSMAIDKAMVLLSDDEQTGDRAILILSDGEDHGDGGVAAAQRAADAGVFLYAIGIGTPSGAPIPVGGGGFKKDRAGQVVISRLQEDRLQEIAAIGRGAYVRSVAGAGDMQTIYQEQIRGQLTAAEQGVRREKIWTERYMLFLALGLALIVASYLLRPGALRLGPAAASILLLTVGTARADTLDALLQQQAAAPDDMALAEEVGEALFEAGRFDEAAGVLEQVAQRGGSQQQDRARYNAGLARYYAGQLTAALEDWQRILSDDPDNTAAQQNATAVEAEIQARLQQQQEQEQQDSDEECDNPQEGEDGEPQDSDSDSDSEEQDSDSDSEPQDSDSEPEESESHDGTMEPPPEEPLAEQSLDTEEEQPAPSPSAEPSSEESAQAAQASEPSEEELAEAAARRLLDSVEEGEPRVTVGEQSRGGNDW